jgi:hypothetical protein
VVRRRFRRLTAAAAAGFLVLLLVTSAQATVGPPPGALPSRPSTFAAAGTPGPDQGNARQAAALLIGMYLVRPWRSRRTRAAVRIGSDNAYGIYLAQMIFITSLGALGWKAFVGWTPFWVWVPLTVAIAYFGGILLTALLARTPLAVPLTGRKQQPWRTLLPQRVPAPATPLIWRTRPAPRR